ncbi:hypothetical protein SB768_08040 [Burkholderia sp. SIMBA_043]|uniref:hypothetical protein n=1 Tax=Burkholderia TaxID=32008 RepID=UPI0005D9A67D|nr:hypothetical protein [Burkholderia vietnamiensis]AJY07043.1 hypothetical protein AK36_2042 [Burkholderia vietnamiensis LMG 10929]AVR17209.1 hypothetical protein A8H33_28640 [Burkholderia vietnamiensis]KVM53886.1 hypothetical protein WJ57_13940 [Burkholderia vietnamiensis]KVR95189.1 hypothetical protein WK30_29495 [Burkholderia vietnamiensis]UBI27554.1 hypothetical protein LA325_15340 [Burkholderia vietnamiensis]
MPKPPLPSIQSPTARQLREIWRRYPEGHEVRTLIIEIVRMRQVLDEAEHYREIVEQVWKEDTGGSHLVALYKLRRLLQDEAGRT